MEGRRRRVREADGGGPLIRRTILTGRLLSIGFAATLALACRHEAPPRAADAGPAALAGPGGFHFTDVSEAAGLTRVLHAGRPGKDHLLDSAGTGAGWIDFDRDGLLDIYLVNGWKLDGSRVIEKGRNALYRNRGDGTFQDVTDAAGVSGEGHWGSGVTVADYDGDGWPDMLVTNFGPNVLYRNRGDGAFENTAAAAGVEAPGWNTGAAFFDADGDGDLDLYVAAYIVATMEEVLNATRRLDWKGVDKVAFGPFGMTGAVDHYFRNEGKGRFKDATAEAGLADKGLAFGFGVRAVDIDDDGDLDLYIANDSDANYLYRNEGNGQFMEVGLWSGAAFDAHGAAQASMGVAAGDVIGDGAVDLFVTNFSEDFSTLYQGDGQGFFEDVSDRTGIGKATYMPLSWGAVFEDLDNDGDRDIVEASGHIYPQVDAHPEFGMTYRQRSTLLENTADGRFADASARAGEDFQAPWCSRGLAAADYDNDGDIDLLLTHLDEPPTLLRNDATGGSWLTVVPAGANGAPVIGARVLVTAGGRTQKGDVYNGGSYLSSHDPRVHFGLGTATMVESVEVIWPGGARSVAKDVKANQFLTMRR